MQTKQNRTSSFQFTNFFKKFNFVGKTLNQNATPNI